MVKWGKCVFYLQQKSLWKDCDAKNKIPKGNFNRRNKLKLFINKSFIHLGTFTNDPI